MRRIYNLFGVSLLLVFIGSFLAYEVQTVGGTVAVRDVRFVGTNGTMMSALLFVPRGVTNKNPAPGIVAIHGYINSRETQSGFAIEFARRGYVVLELDQTGHGYSDPPAFANGFGGPDGLAYLRSLDIVDKNNIGIEGHSMGGWASLSAASAIPDGYKAIVLEGSSTGTLGTAEGTATYPRNLGLVYSTWDEFSQLMWGSDTATNVVNTDKLKKLFNTDQPVEVGKLYGTIADGTARRLYQPRTTHPGDHLSTEAIGDAIDWFQQTLQGGNGLPTNDQIWYLKEFGTFIAMVGMVLFLLPWGALLLQMPFFRELVQPMPAAKPITGAGRWLSYALMIIVPILTYYWLQNFAAQLIPQPTPWFSQTITTGIAVWAVGNGLITLVLFLIWHFTTNRRNGATAATYGLSMNVEQIIKAFLLAACVVAGAYILLAIADFLFKIDFRFWVLSVRPLSGLTFNIALRYLPFFIFFFLVLGVALHGEMRHYRADGTEMSFSRAAGINILLLIVGFIGLLLFQYLPLMSGKPLPLGEPLLTIVAFQFLPLLLVVGLLSTYFFRLTGRVYVGAFVCAMFVTWYIVAGQATQYAFR